MYKPEIGDVYYSVGPLQNIQGLERWTYSDDVYDNNRKESGNCFETLEEAKKFKKYMQEYKNE